MVAKIKFAHAYMINMLYLNTAKYHESVGCIGTSAAGMRARARARGLGLVKFRDGGQGKEFTIVRGMMKK